MANKTDGTVSSTTQVQGKVVLNSKIAPSDKVNLIPTAMSDVEESLVPATSISAIQMQSSGNEEGLSATSSNTGSKTAENMRSIELESDDEVFCDLTIFPESGNKKDGSNTATFPGTSTRQTKQRNMIFALLIFLVGAAASVAYLTRGIIDAKDEQSDQFHSLAAEFVIKLQDVFEDYRLFGLWIHESCRSRGFAETGNSGRNASQNVLGICSRQEFREIHEYITSVGLDFQSIQFMPLVKQEQRDAVEAEARSFYEEEFPDVTYRGIVGFFPNGEGGLEMQPQREEEMYWPVHYIEPVVGNERAIDLDLYTSPTQKKTIQNVVTKWAPGITDRLQLVQETEVNAYSIILHHPGVPLMNSNETEPTSISLVVIRVPDLLGRTRVEHPASFYLYDSTYNDTNPVFLGAQDVNLASKGDTTHTNLQEISLASLEDSIGSKFSAHHSVTIADRQWTIVVVSHLHTYEPDILNVVVGGVLIVAASFVLSSCFWIHMTRVANIKKIEAQAAREKADLIVKSAKHQAVTERQLNEYIAHEVRNPLSSAIAALSFVTATTNEADATEEQMRVMKDDLHIADSSLKFINELLRNMNRAANQQMSINMAPTDIMSDVLEPVASMLYLRGNIVEVLTEGPENVVVMSDRLRLKQIVSNLAMNATKFVERGFIRLKCVVIETEDGEQSVQLHLEDSGPGIPLEKRANLFAKFQESLDLLNQGTGIGLCLSKHLSNLMGGDLWLDESYDSGFEGCPGTRFILDLRARPLREDYWENQFESDRIEPQESTQMAYTENEQAYLMEDKVNPQRNQVFGQRLPVSFAPSPPRAGTDSSKTNHHHRPELPESLNVLFVDDDMILRKLFCRSVRRVAPGWKVEEASNGETTLHILEGNLDKYDVIFVDQYMSSIEKQLLGTETVRLLRAKGVGCIICGLSANDAETPFIKAGADHFLFKPFPCEPGPLKRALLNVVCGPLKRRV
eukprot:scaffold4715_cov115-Cylindrotheca_fusiformis.AAC.9